MASAEIPRSAAYEWAPGNPWWWMLSGLTCCGLAWAWMAALGQNYPAGRFALLTVGLLMAAAAVTIRLKFTQPAFLAGLSQVRRNLLLTALALLLGGLALAVSILLVLAFVRPENVSWTWGQLLVCWVAVAPMTLGAAGQCWNRLRAK